MGRVPEITVDSDALQNCEPVLQEREGPQQLLTCLWVEELHLKSWHLL